MRTIDLIGDISDYIRVLRRDYNLLASFHYRNLQPECMPFMRNILHDRSYCWCIKKNGLNRCVKGKEVAIKRGFHNPKLAVCHAGVAEYIFPVNIKGETVTFVSVSGYRTEKLPDFERIAERVNADPEKLKTEYLKLNPDIPDIETISPLIRPLVHMLELLYSMPSENAPTDRGEAAYNEIFNYLVENYKSNIRISDVCAYVHYSESFVFHVFKKYGGGTINEFLTKLKTEEAAAQLIETDKKILDIAYDVGYNDSNYFTNVFKNRFGVSPKVYRNTHRK